MKAYVGLIQWKGVRRLSHNKNTNDCDVSFGLLFSTDTWALLELHLSSLINCILPCLNSHWVLYHYNSVCLSCKSSILFCTVVGVYWCDVLSKQMFTFFIFILSMMFSFSTLLYTYSYYSILSSYILGSEGIPNSANLCNIGITVKRKY